MVSIAAQGREGRKVVSWELQRAIVATAVVGVISQEGKLVGIAF